MSGITPRLLNCTDLVETGTSGHPSVQKAESLPTVTADFGLVHGASGSASVRIGATEAVCSIFGPRVESSGGGVFSDSGRIAVDVRYGVFAGPAPNRSLSSAESESSLAERLLDALNTTVCLQKYPKCTISVFVVISQSCGSELSAALAACSLALVDAAIEVADIIAPCTALLRNDSIDLYPVLSKRCPSDVFVTAAYSPALDSFPQLYLRGRVDVQTMVKLFEIAKKGSIMMRKELTAVILRKASQNNEF